MNLLSARKSRMESLIYIDTAGSSVAGLSLGNGNHGYPFSSISMQIGAEFMLKVSLKAIGKDTINC